MAVRVVGLIRAGVAGQSLRIGDTAFRLTLSIGVAGFVAGESVRQCVNRADATLYEAKRAGRDRVALAR